MTQPVDVRALHGRPVLLLGAGVSGSAAVRLLALLGARTTVADTRPEALAVVAALGADRVHPDEAAARIGDYALVVTSPGWRPDAPVFAAAAAAGVPVIGDVELCRRADRAGVCGEPRTWLVVTGTNGKTTTTAMLADMLVRGGLRAAACGNIGVPVPEVLLAEPRVDVLACELSSFQLHWAPTLAPEAGAVLNIAPDHLDWHGGMEAYAAAKARVVGAGVRLGVLGLDDAGAAALAAGAGAERLVGFRLDEPGPDELGVVDGLLVDRAFGTAAGTAILPAVEVRPAGPVGVLDALAAAALALGAGVGHADVAAALRDFRVAAHRAAVVCERAGVRYVDDSKATNPHAARGSLLAADSVVWIGGGLLKGASVDELVREVRPRLRAAVLLGRDAPLIAESLARHAPEIPVRTVTAGDDGARESASVMVAAVREAAALARPGDAVVLAPAAASLDMFANYEVRGDAFAAAARALEGETRRSL